MQSSRWRRPATKHLYSDLGFILLGEVVERLSGMPLDRFCHDEIFAPMGLSTRRSSWT